MPAMTSQPFTVTTTSALTIPDLIGPCLSTEQMVALGGPYAQYDVVYDKWADERWKTPPSFADFYYDTTRTEYARWVRSRLELHRERARLALVPYRDYLVAAKNEASPHWTFVVGMACNMVDEGETPENRTKSRDALTGLCGYHWRAGARGWVFSGTVAGEEGRIVGRVIQTFLYGHLMGIVPMLGDNGEVGHMVGPHVDMVACPPHADVVKRLVQLVSENQSPDGAWRAYSYCNQQDSFSAGILNDALEEVDYWLGSTDAELRGMIQRFRTKQVAFLRTQWGEWIDNVGTPTGKYGFRYISGPCPGATNDPEGIAADLTGLIINPIAIEALRTGDPELRAFVETVFANMIVTGQPWYGKQFNQLFSTSYRAAALLHPAAAPSPAPAPLPAIPSRAQIDAVIKAIVWVQRSSGRESQATKKVLGTLVPYLTALRNVAPNA